jgi:hypothetical protein
MPMMAATPDDREQLMILTRTAGATITAAALILGTAGIAAAATKPSVAPRPGQTDTGTSPGTRAPLISDDQRAQLRSSGHVEVIKHTKRRGDMTFEVQRGEITAINATAITVRSKDGYTHSYPVTAKTKVRERRSPIAIGDLKVGEQARVVGLRTKNGDVARRISRIPDRKTAKARTTTKSI